MADATLPGLMLTGTHAARPAATAVGSGALYSCSTHSLVYQSNGTVWSTWATLGGGAPAAHAASHQNGGADEIDATGLTGAGGGGSDPIADKHGTPTTAHEFTTSSLAAFTSIGTPTADADTSVEGHYYISNAAATGLKGHYVAAPAEPWTAITKVVAPLKPLDGRVMGSLFAGTSDLLGGVDVTHFRSVSSVLNFTQSYWNGNPPALNTLVNTGAATEWQSPVYYAIVATTSTAVKMYASTDGMMWEEYNRGNPGYALDAIGIGLALQGAKSSAAFDYLRIWNSALTLLALP